MSPRPNGNTIPNRTLTKAIHHTWHTALILVFTIFFFSHSLHHPHKPFPIVIRMYSGFTHPKLFGSLPYCCLIFNNRIRNLNCSFLNIILQNKPLHKLLFYNLCRGTLIYFFVPNRISLKSFVVISSPNAFLKTSVEGPPFSSNPFT